MVPCDALRRLVEAVRAAGGGFTRRGDALWVRWGALDCGDRAALTPLIRRWKPDLLALIDAETAAAVFRGAQVVTCTNCGGMRWRRAGDGEVCIVCHPAPGSATAGTPQPRRRRTAA